eukprot:m.175654 g.175654  ORF g.175654 m.175654 type:complete len:98 (+) comp31828_c0_seq9:388-681(+)
MFDDVHGDMVWELMSFMQLSITKRKEWRKHGRHPWRHSCWRSHPAMMWTQPSGPEGDLVELMATSLLLPSDSWLIDVAESIDVAQPAFTFWKVVTDN